MLNYFCSGIRHDQQFLGAHCRANASMVATVRRHPSWSWMTAAAAVKCSAWLAGGLFERIDLCRLAAPDRGRPGGRCASGCHIQGRHTERCAHCLGCEASIQRLVRSSTWLLPLPGSARDTLWVLRRRVDCRSLRQKRTSGTAGKNWLCWLRSAMTVRIEGIISSATSWVNTSLGPPIVIAASGLCRALNTGKDR